MVHARQFPGVAAFSSAMLLGAIASLSGQPAAVYGVVTDSATGQPLAGASVRLLHVDRASETLITTTDATGRFRLTGLPGGSYRVVVSHEDFQQRESEFQLLDDVELELSQSALSMVRLMEAELPGVQVTGERISPMMRPFYARRDAGFGHFLTADEVAAKNPKTTYDVLRGIPGIVVRPNPRYGFDGTTKRYLIDNVRMATINECPMLVFLNGVLIGDSRSVDLDFLISPNNVHGVEIYTTIAGLPTQFNVTGARCGVVVFWSSFGERSQERF